MRVYVAGSSSEIDRAQRAMSVLRAQGHTITYDWTEKLLAAPGPDAELGDEVLREHAIDEVHAIQSSDGFLLLVPRKKEWTSALVEFGIAIGQVGRFVVSSGPRWSLFQTLARRVDTDAEALELFGRAR